MAQMAAAPNRLIFPWFMRGLYVTINYIEGQGEKKGILWNFGCWSV
jgi:hypothetical protein